MRHSEQLNELAGALAKAQGELRNPSFDAINPHFKSKFASLANVRDTVVPVLAKHGISVSQWPEYAEAGDVLVTTMLAHASGQWMSSTFCVPVAKKDAHGTGASITYARRYALMSCVGVVGDTDDDGNAAVAPARPSVDTPSLSAEVTKRIASSDGDRDKLMDVWKWAQIQCSGDVSTWNAIKALFPRAKAEGAA